ncbi:energy-coupling factor ABC transporter ATP-binding protein [Sporosalibacterium faouarense]|uniref:energy-coupling factor ABC transporter ATP-binding protein n=1 Tax=Sporosalibacterium faouarense TaxID=516123 RepID=UPI00141CF59F|nr:ATP-binding cassette domain-containing protein [Sporosalibacterium faouarense]MTI46550.1 ATP-binding cassette domain-containing protein [Bacillota bacterium]
MLKTNNLKYIYEDGTIALKNITIDLNVGNIIGIIGSNGSGKTTLFLNLLGILKPTEGEIYLGIDKYRYNKKFLVNLRKSVGIVFQNPDRQIFYSKVYDDIAFGLRNLGYDEDEVKERVDRALKKVDGEDFKDKPVHFLSYGQKKRVAIAGVLAMDNEVIFFDEPTAGLDPDMERRMIEILKGISNEGKKIVIASHDMNLIYRICDYGYVLNRGEILASDKIEKVFLMDDILEKAKLAEPWLVKLHKNLEIPLFKKEEELYSYWKNNKNPS